MSERSWVRNPFVATGFLMTMYEIPEMPTVVDCGDKAELTRDMARSGGASGAARGLRRQLLRAGDALAPCGVCGGAVSPVPHTEMPPIKPCIPTNCPCFRVLSAASGGWAALRRPRLQRVGRTLVVSVVPRALPARRTTAPSGGIIAPIAV